MPRTSKANPSEASIKKDITAYFNCMPGCRIHYNAASKHSERGWPDMEVIRGFTTLRIEVKRRGKWLEPHQEGSCMDLLSREIPVAFGTADQQGKAFLQLLRFKLVTSVSAFRKSGTSLEPWGHPLYLQDVTTEGQKTFKRWWRYVRQTYPTK